MIGDKLAEAVLILIVKEVFLKEYEPWVFFVSQNVLILIVMEVFLKV